MAGPLKNYFFAASLTVNIIKDLKKKYLCMFMAATINFMDTLSSACHTLNKVQKVPKKLKLKLKHYKLYLLKKIGSDPRRKNLDPDST